MNAVAEQIKHEADKTMRELEQSGLALFQIDRLSGKVNGLMLAYEIAQTARREPLTTAEIEQLLARWDYHLHGDRARYLVREAEKAHGITKGTP
jgi:hypothetical protein